jgi:hypothetical protein
MVTNWVVRVNSVKNMEGLMKVAKIMDEESESN